MYILERGFQWSKNLITYEEATAEIHRKHCKPGAAELDAPCGVGESVSSAIYDNESLYAYTDKFIDLRTPNDEKKGVITAFLLWVYGFIFYYFLKFSGTAVEYISAGYGYYDDVPLVAQDYFFLPLFPLLLLLVLFFLENLRLNICGWNLLLRAALSFVSIAPPVRYTCCDPNIWVASVSWIGTRPRYLSTKA